MNRQVLGWMVVATTPTGKMAALPATPEALDRLDMTLFPTLGGVWSSEGEALGAWKGLPDTVRIHFQVVPITITILDRRF